MKAKKTVQNQLLIITAFFVIFIGFIIISFGIRHSRNDYYNIITFFFSVFLFLYGLTHFLKNGLQISNAFLISFYFFLALNCFNVSLLQKPKTLTDIYFYFFGPLMFYLIINYLEKATIKLKYVNIKLSYELVCKGFLIMFIALYGYIFKTKGIRFFSNTLKSEQQSLYVVSGISGLIDVLAWLLLMLSFSTKKKVLKILMILCPILFTFFSASRTLTMRMLIFMGCYVFYSKGKKAANSKSIFRAMFFGVGVIVGFGVWGNYREKVSGFMTISISAALQSVSNNTIFDWLYAYSAFNYDVIKQVVIEKNFPFRFRALLRPILRVVGGSSAIGQYNKIVSSEVGSIKGFNGSTFLLHPIFELKYFYFIELFILAVIVAIMAKISKTLNFRGGYVYYIMASVMTVFGEYYLDINGFYAVVMGIIICYLIRPTMKFES